MAFSRLWAFALCYNGGVSFTLVVVQHNMFLFLYSITISMPFTSLAAILFIELHVYQQSPLTHPRSSGCLVLIPHEPSCSPYNKYP